jgi:hypothetical protein
LANILGIRPVPLPIHKRLENDFLDSDSEESEPPVKESKKELEQDLKQLLNLSTLNPKIPETPPEIKDNYKPQPYLFRVNIPNPKPKSQTSVLYESESESEPEYKTITDDDDDLYSELKPKSEVLSVSELLFDPQFKLTAPPLILRKPEPEPELETEPEPEIKPIMSSFGDSFVLPDYHTLKQTTPLRRRLRSRNKRLQNANAIANANAKFFNKNKSKKIGKIRKTGKSKKTGKTEKRNVNLFYKTPSPKTYRIHLTSNKGSNSGYY